MIEIKNLRYSKPLNKPWEFRVDRTSPVGNPFYMESETERDKVCDKYEAYFKKQLEGNKAFNEYLNKMRAALNEYGRIVLYCWCAPKRCHAETIKRWLEENL